MTRCGHRRHGLRATRVLPEHLVVVRRAYSGQPRTLQALSRLQDALAEVDMALLAPRSRDAAT